ncbi:MAG: hypothetical protein AAB407_01450 [Patescibacteria group bacterium]
MKRYFFFLLSGFGLAFVFITYATPWSEPSQGAPQGSVPESAINESSLLQQKQGGIALNTSQNAPTTLVVAGNGPSVGRVGIGTVNPAHKLDVIGSISIGGGGRISANGSFGAINTVLAKTTNGMSWQPRYVWLTLLGSVPSTGSGELTCDVSVSNASASKGDGVQISWDSMNAVDCTGSDGLAGQSGTSGSMSQTISKSTIYTIMCSDTLGNTCEDSETIIVDDDGVGTSGGGGGGPSFGDPGTLTSCGGASAPMCAGVCTGKANVCSPGTGGGCFCEIFEPPDTSSVQLYETLVDKSVVLSELLDVNYFNPIPDAEASNHCTGTPLSCPSLWTEKNSICSDVSGTPVWITNCYRAL